MKYLFIFIFIFSTGESLNKFLKHYEPLTYRPTDLNRFSRSADEKIRLNFHAYDRDFKLILERVQEKDSVFLKGATMEYENKTEKIEWEHNIFKGIIEGDDNSYVSGSINHGIFEGVIETSNGEEFWIESSYPYNSTSPFHSFIYSSNDVEMPEPSDRSKRGYSYFNRNYKNEDQFEFPRKNEHSRQPEPPKRNTHNKRPYEICEGELKGTGSRSSLKNPQYKRETVSMDENGISSNRICTLKITIDHTLYEYVFNGAGRGDTSATHSELMSMMGNQLKRVNDIYKKIDFGGITGIHFKIAGFRFYTKANDIANPFVKETTISQTFLDWHSASNFSDYCLSYVFTYRDFDQDTLGLAFSCYACTKAGSRSAKVSYNTGMVTFRSHGNEIPERQRHLTLAHELGHSLGSDHDHQPLASGKLESEVYPECDSDGKTGHYIMYPNANDGKKPNHELLSVCSIRNITRNLKRLLSIDPRHNDAMQTNCFISESTPICGNGIREGDEVCDCGHNEQECLNMRDQCCWHGDHPLKCTLKSTAYECSPTQGSCCSENCKFKGASEICSPDKDCRAVTYCLPGNYTCPESKPANNGLPCNDATGTCLEGECGGSICAAEGLQECEPAESLCVRHCLFEGKCTSTADLPQFSHQNYTQKGRWGHKGLLKKANEICRESLGRCDDVGVCRNIVSQEALAEGKKDHGIRTFGEYLQDHWWLLIVVIITGIVILGLCIVLCYYKVPKLSLRSPREKRTVQIEVKAAESSPVKAAGAPVEPKSSDANANPPAPDASKVAGTVAPSTLTGQMRLTNKLVNGLTITAFPLQLISFVYFYVQTNYGFIVFFLLSIFAHILYYYRVIRNEEHQYKRHFFYYQVSVAVIQGLMFSTDWHSSLDNIFSIQYWLLVLPWIVQATTCIITYLHDRKAEADGTPTNLYDEEKEEQFKKSFVIAVVMFAFPMQLIFFGLNIAFLLGEIVIFGSIVLIATSIFVHIRYYLKVVRKGEKQYKAQFFYFEMAVAIMQAFVVSSSNLFNFSLIQQISPLCMILQVIACCALYFHNEKTTVSSGLPSYSDVIKNEIDAETKKEKTELPVYSVELKKEIVPVV